MKTLSRRTVLAGAAVLLPAGGAALSWWLGLWDSDAGLPRLPPGQRLEAAQLEPRNRLPAFRLERAGAALTADALRGRWSFVFFGYTNCPNACPATLAELNHVQETLHVQGMEAPRIVFISLDPQRDTPEVLQRYAAAFGSDVVGATGADEALRPLLGFFGITVERRPGADAAGYTLDHTTNFFLLTPDGRWLATFGPGEDAEAIVQDTMTLMRLPAA